MDVQTGFFYLFSAALLFAAFRVITARNPVHAVLYLMLAFSQASAIWFLLQAEFLAIALVLVYLGAVMVLFLFVVMMLDINFEELRAGFWKHFPLAALIGGLIALEMSLVMVVSFGDVAHPQSMSAEVAAHYSNTKEIGKLLYQEYLYPIEVAALILLVGMVAAIALTLRERKDSKHVSVGQQVRARASERMAVIKLPATAAAQPPAPPEEAAAQTPEK